MSYVEDVYRDWGLGVVTSILPDEIPLTASPEARNAILVNVGAGKGVPATRKGLTTRNRTAVVATPIHNQVAYKRRDGTIYHIGAHTSGQLVRLLADDTTATLSTALGASVPSFTVANDLCFITSTSAQLKLRGLTVEGFGITRPSPPTPAAGSAGAMTGTYEVALTFYNTNTGHESSRSDAASITVTATTIDVSWSAPSDAQVTHTRVYLRKPTLGTNFFQVAQVTAATTTAGIDVSDTSYSALITVGPDTVENDPPPGGCSSSAWHRSRLFLADETNLYYSKIALPEAFDPEAFEPVNADDGQTIVGLLSAEDRLYVLKRDSVWALEGDDPATWYLTLVDASTGCTSFRSIWTVEQTAGWWSEHGPVVLSGGRLANIGQPTIRTLIEPTALNTARLGEICAAVDVVEQRVLWLTSSSGSSENDQWLSYNYRLGVWEGIWDPMAAASIIFIEDAQSRPWVHIGSYLGQFFRVFEGTNDGVASGTKTGTLTASGTSMSSFTGLSGLDTTGTKLAGRILYLVSATGTLTGRATISTNTATAITTAAAITGLTSGATYTWFIGAIDFRWSTKWSDFGEFSTKKRFTFLEGQVESASQSIAYYIDMSFNFDTSVGQAKTVTTTNTADAAEWDVSLWDSSLWGIGGTATPRYRIGRTGRAYRARVRFLGHGELELRKLRIRADNWRARG